MLDLIPDKNKYYKALFDSYVEAIRQSGLLLDEDLEILINNNENYELYQFPKYRLSLKLKSSIASLLGSLLLAKQYNIKWIILPPILFTTISTISELRKKQVEKNQKLVVENIINVSKKIHFLYGSIRKYMKMRFEIENKSLKDCFKGCNKNIQNFFNTNFTSEVIFFKNIMISLENFVKYTDKLVDDYKYIKDFEPFDKDLPMFDNMDRCMDFLKQVNDINIWLTSKMLNYIGVIFSFYITLSESSINTLLNKSLPSLLIILNQHYDKTRKSFYSLRNSVNKLTERNSLIKKPHTISNKLHNTLLSAVDNISIISEKSSKIFEAIENTSDNCSPELESAILDLRNHTYAAYESIDVLCRLYGILSSQNIPTNKVQITSKENNSEPTITVHHDDKTETIEEQFELYVEKDFVPQEEPQIYVDESGAYLNLMLQELKQSLKKHERFIEAKKRRGSLDEEKIIEEKVLPTFNLKALEIETDDTTNNAFITSSTSTSVPLGVVNLPPPPPPPIPKTFNLNVLPEESNQKSHTKSMLDSIKTLSSQLNMEEEVFGEFDEEDD